MIKTLQVCGNSAYGGCAPLVYKWCEYLLSQGCQVDVLATDRIWSSMLKQIRGLRVIESIYIPREIVPTKDLIGFCKLLMLLRSERYDVVHTYTSTPGFIGRMAARFIGVPVVLHHQAGWTVNEFSSLQKRMLYTPLEYLATVVSTRAICVSHAVEQQGRRLHIAPQNKLTVICNGIELLPFNAAIQNERRELLRREIGLSDNHLLIGNTGRLSEQKDNGSLIKAMAYLRSLIPNTPFTLLLAGDGPEMQKLKDLVSSLDLGEKVRLLGFRRDIPTFLAGLDIFVSPSLWEGLSISLLEAMAAAKPIVATSILPNAELIKNEVTGLLVSPKSPEKIAHGIFRLVREPGLGRRCADAARRRVMEEYQIDRMLQQTWDLYLELLSQKKYPPIIKSFPGKGVIGG